jgi:hypothetical protein
VLLPNITAALFTAIPFSLLTNPETEEFTLVERSGTTGMMGGTFVVSVFVVSIVSVVTFLHEIRYNANKNMANDFKKNADFLDDIEITDLYYRFKVYSGAPIY